MRLAKDFHTPKSRLGYRLVHLGRRWRQTVDARLNQEGLTDAVWTPLVHLHRLGDGVSQSELAAAVGIDGSSLVRVLDALVTQGLIERRAHATDRRIKQLYLTTAGRTTVTGIRKHLLAIEKTLLADIDEDDAQRLLDAFDRIGERINALHEKSAQ